jgi:NitT/TauT family transport system substrate-binding protein
VVRGFVRAALRGWKDALANPEEAARIQVQTLGARSADRGRGGEASSAASLSSPTWRRTASAHLNRDKMKRTVDFINANVGAGHEAAVDDIMVEGFLPKDLIRP